MVDHARIVRELRLDIGPRDRARDPVFREICLRLEGLDRRARLLVEAAVQRALVQLDFLQCPLEVRNVRADVADPSRAEEKLVLLAFPQRADPQEDGHTACEAADCRDPLP